MRPRPFTRASRDRRAGRASPSRAPAPRAHGRARAPHGGRARPRRGRSARGPLAASSPAARARGLDDVHATKRRPTVASTRSISSTSLSARIDATTVKSPGGRWATSQRTPPGLCAPSRISPGRALQAAGQRHAGERARSTGAPRKASAAATASSRPRRRDEDRARARRPGRALPLRLAEDDGAAGADDGELLGGDRLPRLAEDLGVVERDVRQHDDADAVEHVRRVVASAEPRLDRRRLDGRVGEREERRGGRAPRTASRRSAPRAAGLRSSGASSSASAPFTRTRSDQTRTCGERNAPVRSPRASSSASTIRVVVDLPFVPTTWTAGSPACGSPRAARSSRIRPSPNPSRGHGGELLEPGDTADGRHRTGQEPSSSSSRR